MKLLIQNDLRYTETHYPGISDDEYESVCDMLDCAKEILDRLGVYHSIENKESYFSVEIPVQKISLTEEGMNELFSDILYDFPFGFSLNYAFLGGKGCEFSLEITCLKP